MNNDFYENLTTLTSNIDDIKYLKYGTITNMNNDGTVTVLEGGEDSITHENVPLHDSTGHVGDAVVLGFTNNSFYEPTIITGGQPPYTKPETDKLLKDKVDEPETEGTPGQVLATDGAGGRTWKTVQGEGGGVVMVGSFEIDTNGHLIATIPTGTSNPYLINENGHLTYNTGA